MPDAQIISPVDGSIFATAPYASAEEINLASQKARSAAKTWRAMSIAQRSTLCRAFVDYLAQRASDLATELSWQMGRPIAQTPFEITGGFVERATHMIDIAPSALAPLSPPSDQTVARKIVFQPHGVALVIAAWNYPYLTAVNTLIPALMAGNTVILKHAQQTFLVGDRLQEAATAVGFPDGVLTHLRLTHEQTARLIASSAVDFVNFTGSVSGGQAIQHAAANRFIHRGLELGGKDPAYVCADAALEQTAYQLVDGSFFNAGQSCCGIERIYVDEAIFEPFLEAFIEETKRLTLGNPLAASTTLGPVISVHAAQNIKDQIAQARAMGAVAHLSESDFAGDLPANYLPPQILTKVTHEMDVMREESFGPVIGIMPVKDSAQAVQLMNDSAYGLTASIWTHDFEKAEQIGSQIKCGTFFMNRCDYLDPRLAWGGVGDSGYGAALSTLGYQNVTRPQSFHMRRSL